MNPTKLIPSLKFLSKITLQHIKIDYEYINESDINFMFEDYDSNTKAILTISEDRYYIKYYVQTSDDPISEEGIEKMKQLIQEIFKLYN